MEYQISLNILCKESIDTLLQGSTKVAEIIDFLVETFSKLLGNDSSRICITSKKLNRLLLPNETLVEILKNCQQDSFLVTINQKYQIDFRNIEIKFQYNGVILECDMSFDTSLDDLYQFAVKQFNIEGKPQMIWENLNLSSLPGSTIWKDIQIKNGGTIKFFSSPQSYIQQQKQNQGETFKLEVSIEVGVINRSIILNCDPNDNFQKIQQCVLDILGIKNDDFVEVDLYFSDRRMNNDYCQRNFRQLREYNYGGEISAKLRYIGRQFIPFQTTVQILQDQKLGTFDVDIISQNFNQNTQSQLSSSHPQTLISNQNNQSSFQNNSYQPGFEGNQQHQFSNQSQNNSQVDQFNQAQNSQPQKDQGQNKQIVHEGNIHIYLQYIMMKNWVQNQMVLCL